MTKPKAAKAAAPRKAAKANAEDAPVADGKLRIYPTHRLSPGPLRVFLPAVDGNSDELVIDDDGLDVDERLANHLIAFRDATLEKPEA